jgi:ABC-type nitrate/sulfonate/bicarbonate transport system substrate-binding protein
MARSISPSCGAILSPPANGQTLVILRRDAIAIVLPANSQINDIPGLAGKTIAIPAGPLQEENSAALDKILGYYNVAPAAVKRDFLSPADIGAAFHQHRVAAGLQPKAMEELVGLFHT